MAIEKKNLLWIGILENAKITGKNWNFFLEQKF